MLQENKILVLIVDDDKEISLLVSNYLSKYNIECLRAHNGSEMREIVASHNIELLILDLMLPQEDGLSLCQEIRKSSQIPILMLTARGELADRVIGLESGADDYIVKPFEPRELVARIRSALRRREAQYARPSQNVEHIPLIHFGDWQLNSSTRELISKNGLIVHLSNAEFRLLWVFLQSKNRLLSREQLLDAARGRNIEVFDRSIDLLVSRLRQKLGDDPKTPSLIRTIRGEGYIFSANIK